MFDLFLVALAPQNLLWMVIGSFVGAIIGFLPGIGAGTAIVIYLPITFNLPPATALITLVSIYTSGAFGGNITAILFNTPGESDAVFMCFDGYPMTVRGEGARALGLTTISAFFGGMVGSLALLFVAPPIAMLAIKFGPLELFLTTMLGVVIIVSLSKGNMLKGLLSGMLGFLCAMVGTDKLTGLPRFSFGIEALYDDLPLMPVVLGIFALSQMFQLAMNENETISQDNLKSARGSTWIPIKDLFRKLPLLIYSSLVGTIVGIIPAAGSTVANGICYSILKKIDKNPDTVGKGNENGLVVVSAANNAVVGGSLVPLLTLAIPGNGTSSLFLGGLLIHGLSPGMSLFTSNRNIIYPVLFGMVICQFFILLSGMFGGKYLARLTNVPNSILIPIIGVLVVLGAYSFRNLGFDMYLMLFFGILGIIMIITEIPLAPFVLSLVLGSIAETQLRRSILLLEANFFGVLFHPLNMVLLVCNLSILISPFWRKTKYFFRNK